MESIAKDRENIPLTESDIHFAKDTLDRIRQELTGEITGQEAVVKSLLISLACQGHVLLEGMPGLAKTLLAKSLSSALDLDFKRVQFTPDLLPADLIGTVVFNPKNGEFNTRKGPIFTGVLLADEINRAPAKVQSALLECMEERTVTIGENTFPLERPFLVLATENPIDQDGTYPLPEAQMDRFFMKVLVDYPDMEEELAILEQHGKLATGPKRIKKTATAKDVLKISSLVDRVHVEPKLKSYIVRLVRNTRPEEKTVPDLLPYVKHGASPRASLSLLKASKAKALWEGRDYVAPEDVKAVLPEILRHRILLTFEAISEDVGIESVVRIVSDATQVL